MQVFSVELYPDKKICVKDKHGKRLSRNYGITTLFESIGYEHKYNKFANSWVSDNITINNLSVLTGYFMGNCAV